MKKGSRKLIAFLVSILVFTAIALLVPDVDLANLGFSIASINLTFAAPNTVEHYQSNKRAG